MLHHQIVASFINDKITKAYICSLDCKGVHSWVRTMIHNTQRIVVDIQLKTREVRSPSIINAKQQVADDDYGTWVSKTTQYHDWRLIFP